jgi:hypothetical protein
VGWGSNPYILPEGLRGDDEYSHIIHPIQSLDELVTDWSRSEQNKYKRDNPLIHPPCPVIQPISHTTPSPHDSISVVWVSVLLVFLIKFSRYEMCASGSEHGKAQCYNNENTNTPAAQFSKKCQETSYTNYLVPHVKGINNKGV